MQGGDEDGEGGGSDIGALLGNLGPLIGGLSGVSSMFKKCLYEITYHLVRTQNVRQQLEVPSTTKVTDIAVLMCYMYLFQTTDET